MGKKEYGNQPCTRLKTQIFSFVFINPFSIVSVLRGFGYNYRFGRGIIKKKKIKERGMFFMFAEQRDLLQLGHPELV